MREICTYGSVRGALSNERPYRDISPANRTGARVIKPAQKTFWGGYSGYFQDPDGHLWEVLFNPAFIPD